MANPSSVATTTSTSQPPPSTIESLATTSFQRFEGATLQPVGSPVILSGYLADEHVLLPDGRLVLFTFEESDWRLLVFDPNANRVDLETQAPFTGGVRPLGYSPALEQVVMIGFASDAPFLFLFDPSTGSFADEPAFGGSDIGWVYEAALIDEGRKVAIYETFGYDEARIGEPPTVRVGDFVTDTLGAPLEVTGVVHGHAQLAPDAIRNPDWPYGEVEPAIVFDEVGARLFVVHADGAGLTTVDLLAGAITVKGFAEPPTFWTRFMSWLVPPAQAKGSEPSASLSAWLSSDRSQLYVTGEAGDAWRDEENRLHTTHTPLGLMVINTETLELDRVLELPVNYGLSASSAVVLTGSGGTRIWCDEVCKPGNNEPDVEGEYESSGLIFVDPTTLQINQHLSPGQGFHPRGAVNDWLLVETFDDEAWGYETINLITGESGGRAEISGSAYFIITDKGFFLASQSG
ncbi:MAG: hypothetical protein L0Z47_08205 [Actinobacteria bacterium]|nr:hypothetical protein [Actinomycetota bacterium]